MIWIADAHRDDGKRFVVRADEKLSAFLERELQTRARGIPQGLAGGSARIAQFFAN